MAILAQRPFRVFLKFHPTMPISRKDSFTLQVLQLTDALLVWAAFLIGGTLQCHPGLGGHGT